MADQKTDSPKIDTSHEIPVKETAGSAGSNITPGTTGQPSDWNPNVKPLDGSPVLTAVPQYRPASGQAGAKFKTVAQHNAEVLAIAEARDKGDRAGGW